MAQRAIREIDAKNILVHAGVAKWHGVLVDGQTDWKTLSKDHPWLLKEKLVVKPDQCFGQRGKHGLVLLNADLKGVEQFVRKNMNRVVELNGVKGPLTHFLIEPFVPHQAEYYAAIQTEKDHDVVFFSLKGGVDVEENWDRIQPFKVGVLDDLDSVSFGLPKMPERDAVHAFLKKLYRVFAENDFSFLELNPFCMVDGKPVLLDAVARLDDTAAFKGKWNVEFPAPFGRTLSKEEAYIKSLDEKTGASLKLTVLNPKGKIWTLVAGGGASVVYADTIVDLGFQKELANYGEYSGNPNDEETYLYTKTVLELLVKGNGQILLIGGGIANFTDVAKTFKGIIQALSEFAPALKKKGVKIYVRRGGPNYQQGLEHMRQLGEKTGLSIQVFGPETHMTKIVPMALEELK
ncbi:ATPase [Candidatus Micrarchaeota archaeon]|nr:ATPase [Candidatus Micrarchaeota archaeon]